MMPVLLIALLVLVLPFPAHAATRGDVFRQAKAATALVVAVNDNAHSVSLGSGFFVNPDGLLITWGPDFIGNDEVPFNAELSCQIVGPKSSL